MAHAFRAGLFLACAVRALAERASAIVDDGLSMMQLNNQLSHKLLEHQFLQLAEESSDPPMFPRMGKKDLARVYQLMSHADNYREFGSGGSTVQALSFQNIKHVVTTESDKAFCDKMRGRADVQGAITTGRLVLKYADIGPTGEWGRPVDKSHRSKWPAYSFMNNSVGIGSTWFDLVLVDGRFRVACLLRAVKATPADKTSETTFAIHDYKHRRQYHAVEEFVDDVIMPFEDIDDKWKARAKFDARGPKDDILGVFRIRSGLDVAKLDAAIEKYEYDDE